MNFLTEAVLDSFNIFCMWLCQILRTYVLWLRQCLTEILLELFFESTCLFQSPHLQWLRQYTGSKE